MSSVKPHWSESLNTLNPCSEARAWMQTQPSARVAWNNCERGDWMLLLLGKLSGGIGSASRKKLVLAAADCAALALPIWRKRYPDDKRVAHCIKTCRAYARGRATVDQLRSARCAADAAYSAAYSAAYGAYAAYSAAYAASASYAAYAAYAASYAAYAAAAAAYAASYAAYAAADDARNKMCKRCADVVRKHYPNPPRVKAGAA